MATTREIIEEGKVMLAAHAKRMKCPVPDLRLDDEAGVMGMLLTKHDIEGEPCVPITTPLNIWLREQR